MSIQAILEIHVKEGFSHLFETELPEVEFQATRKDFEGDMTIVIFPCCATERKSQQIGHALGNYLAERKRNYVLQRGERIFEPGHF